MPGPFYQEGRYRAEIVNQALGKNQNTGTPQFVLLVQILSQLNGGEEQSVRQQYERSIYLYLSEGAAPYTVEKLQALGFQGSSFRELDLNNSVHHDFRRTMVDVICKWEKDREGETREKWDLARVNSGEIEITPLDDKEARKLDALFGKSLGKAKAETKPAARNTVSAPAAVEDPVEITDDDIPF